MKSKSWIGLAVVVLALFSSVLAATLSSPLGARESASPGGNSVTWPIVAVTP
jgi:hypothetical protein